MTKRPLSITIISWLFIALGIFSLLVGLLPIGQITAAHHIAELTSHWYVHVSRIAAAVSGIGMLYGFNWARWLLVAWLLFHIVVGGLHSTAQLGTHLLLFLIVMYFLFRPAASAYFRSSRAMPPQIPNAQ